MAFADPLPIGQRGDDEGPDGVAVHWHPDALLLRHPELAATVDRFRVGARREVTREDYEALTHWEVEAVLVLMAASGRAETRRMKERTREYADGAGQSQPRQGAG